MTFLENFVNGDECFECPDLIFQNGLSAFTWTLVSEMLKEWVS